MNKQKESGALAKRMTVGPDGDYQELLPAILGAYIRYTNGGSHQDICLLCDFRLKDRLSIVYNERKKIAIEENPEGFILSLPTKDLSWLSIRSYSMNDRPIEARGSLTMSGVHGLTIEDLNIKLMHNLFEGKFLHLIEAELNIRDVGIRGYQHNFDTLILLDNYSKLSANQLFIGASAYNLIEVRDHSKLGMEKSRIDHDGECGILAYSSTLNLLDTKLGLSEKSNLSYIQAVLSFVNCSKVHVINRHSTTIDLESCNGYFYECSAANSPGFYNFCARNNSKITLDSGIYRHVDGKASHFNIVAEGAGTVVTLKNEVNGGAMGVAGGKIVRERS